MSEDLYSKAKALFQEAMERKPPERAAFVDGRCGDDTDLKREVMSWLSASDGAGATFLGVPIVKICETCDDTFTSETKFCPHCGQVLQDDPRALVGTRLDNLYQIEELLGRGGMGAVYRARHALLGDKVAIKTLKRELCDSPTFLRRFQREGQAARSFHHPNAVVVHDLRTTPAGLLYMVLEYIDGVNLRKLLGERKRLSPADAVALLEPMASVLDAAHARGVVHRDMKPENVMIAEGPDGRPLVKVLDLGIAKMRAPEEENTVTELTTVGELLGTPHYMSPEQWGQPSRDGGTEVDGRADVYSLGVIAFELVTGDWPYRGKSVEEYRRAHLFSEIPLAHEVASGVPGRFGAAIAKALAKDRADRWPSAGAFVAELRAAAGDYTVEMAPVGAVETAAFGGATMVEQGVVEHTRIAHSSAGPKAVEPERRPAVAAVEAKPPVKRSRAWMAAVVAVVVVAVAAVAASVVWGPWRTSVAEPPAQPAATPTPAAPATVEAVRYTIEVKGRDGAVARTSGREPIGRVDGYRFLFTPAVAGRIAIVGPNTRNIPTLFLAATDVAAASPFTFPGDDWFHTTGDTPSDTVTIVFVPASAVTPAFAAGRAGRQLSVDEQSELARFVDSYRVTPAFADADAALAAASADRPVAAAVTVRY